MLTNPINTNAVGGVRQRLVIHTLKSTKSKNTQTDVVEYLQKKQLPINILNDQAIELVNVTPENVEMLATRIQNVTTPPHATSKYSAVLFFDHFDPRARNKQYRAYSHLAPQRRPRKTESIKNKYRKQKGSFLATDLQEIYRFPKVAPTDNKTTIGIISLAGSFNIDDLTDYWTKVCGLTEIPQVTVVSVDGAQYQFGEDPDSDLENTLDIEILGGANPHCNIVVYSAPNTDTGFYNAVSTAIYDRKNAPSILSISWGSPEDQSSVGVILAMSELFEKAVKRGINIFVASGDNGAGDGESGVHVDFPASSPYVTSCGGTTLKCRTNDYNNPSTQEVAWSWNREYGWGTGGGLSSLFPVPWYQKRLVPMGFDKPLTKRAIPDISAVADPRSPITIFFKGETTEIGGTSAVAPLMAALVSRLNISVFFTPLLYEARQINDFAFHDILKGSNPVFKCGPGYTCCCGCGSLDATNFKIWFESKRRGTSQQDMIQILSTLSNNSTSSTRPILTLPTTPVTNAVTSLVTSGTSPVTTRVPTPVPTLFTPVTTSLKTPKTRKTIRPLSKPRSCKKPKETKLESTTQVSKQDESVSRHSENSTLTPDTWLDELDEVDQVDNKDIDSLTNRQQRREQRRLERQIRQQQREERRQEKEKIKQQSRQLSNPSSNQDIQRSSQIEDNQTVPVTCPTSKEEIVLKSQSVPVKESNKLGKNQQEKLYFQPSKISSETIQKVQEKPSPPAIDPSVWFSMVKNVASAFGTAVSGGKSRK